MAEQRPAGQIKGQDVKAQAVEAGILWEDCRDAAQLCKDGVRKSKAQLELRKGHKQ